MSEEELKKQQEEELKKQQEEELKKQQEDSKKDKQFQRFIRGDFGNVNSSNAKRRLGDKVYTEYMKKIKENKKGK